MIQNSGFHNGGLAQLARALALHARGHRFDSDILHNSSRFDENLIKVSNNNCEVFNLLSIIKFIDILVKMIS